MEYQGDLEALRFLHYGGYCGFTSMGTAVVPADVAEAYDELNTEKFRSERHYRSQVWACCKAAVYLTAPLTQVRWRQSARQLAVRQMQGKSPAFAVR